MGWTLIHGMWHFGHGVWLALWPRRNKIKDTYILDSLYTYCAAELFSSVDVVGLVGAPGWLWSKSDGILSLMN